MQHRREAPFVTRQRNLLQAAALLALGALAFGSAVPAAAQVVAMQFHWQASPVPTAKGLTPAAFYEVFLLRGADGEAFAATVEDTVFTLEAEPDVMQRICVRAVDAQGVPSTFSEWSDPVFFESNDNSQLVPPVAVLQPNYPNPFNPETRITYGVPDGVTAGDPIRLEIFTVDGRHVRSFEPSRTAGWHQVTWDGTDDSGQVAAAGLYITRFALGAMVKTTKMTMVK
jgi:hypothetical protein